MDATRSTGYFDGASHYEIHELAWNKTGFERHSITEELDLPRVNAMKKQLAH
jgi:hypothetical protein